MQGKSDTEKSFRIMDLLQRKDVEHHEDAPIELTCKRRSSSGSRSTSTSTSTSSRVQSVKQRHGREEGVSLLKPGKSRGKPSPPDSPPESPESPPNRNIVTPPTYPALISSLHHHHPHATFPFHGQFPHLGSAFPKIFGLEHPHWFGMSLESSKDGATLGHGHHTHPQINGHSPFLSSSSPNASPVLTNLLLHSHGIHRTPHNHLTPLDFSLWHGTGNATKAHGHSSGPSLIHPYPDPRLFDYAYPASTLLSRIACKPILFLYFRMYICMSDSLHMYFVGKLHRPYKPIYVGNQSSLTL